MSAESVVYDALLCASSQDPQLLKPAELKLAEWEKEPGFYNTLVSLFSEHSINGNVRWMAALYFKNGIEKYWRKNAPHAIAQGEKDAIKRTLLLNFNEPIPQIAIQIAVLIGRIARYDCPLEWPELVPTLVEVVQSNDSLIQHRALLVLVYVVKTLSSKRLQRDRMLFEDLTSKLYDFVLNLWDGFTQIFFKNIQDQVPLNVTGTNLEKAILSLRILKKMTIFGFQKPNQSEKCMIFINVVFQRLRTLLECRLQLKALANADNLVESIEKFILKHMKFLNFFIEMHRFSFIDFVPPAFEFSFHYVFHEGTNMIFEDNEITFPNFAIQCLNLMKGVLQTPMGSDSEKEMPLNVIKNTFYTAERLSYIFDKIIMHYFLLTRQDFELWDADPESFVLDESGDSWKYNLRACTEAFYMVLFQKYSSLLLPELQKYIAKSQSIQLNENSSINDLLIKDSIYNATGLVVFNLFDEINFDQWFTEQLLVELKYKSNNFRIVRKRIIWLVGQWTGVQFSKKMRPQVYAACLDLLQASEDLAVRLTASKTLKNIMDDFDFDAEQFVEYLDPSLVLLFNLLKESKECDTKMTILYVMSFIVEKMSVSIKLEADDLIKYLPLLWEESVEHNMLRCAIISTLLQIIKALYEVPDNSTVFIYKIIEISTNVNDPSHVYLQDEGLELWLIVVQYSKQMNQELLKLCDNLHPLIEQSSMSLRTCLSIVQTYIFLCPEIFLPRYGKDIVHTCHFILTDLRAEAHVIVNRLFLTILRVAPDYAIELLKPILIDVFRKFYNHDSYLTLSLIYLQMIARVLIIDQNMFSQILAEMGNSDAWEKIMSLWLEKMPVVSATDDKKLLALALSSVIVVPNNIIYDNFSGIIQGITETLNDIMNDDEKSGTKVDSLILTSDNETDIGMMMFGYGIIDTENMQNETPHYDRCRTVCLNDPTHTIVLKDYFQTQLFTLRTQLGDERYQTLFQKVGRQILDELKQFVNLGIIVPSQ